MASTHDDTFAKYKLYSGAAVGAIVLGMLLDSCSGGPDEEIMADAGGKQVAVAAVANTAEDNLKPIETLVMIDKDAPVAPARNGETVYQAACLACHAAGVLNAPKLEAGAWDDRIAKGLDGLTQSAIMGINAMPARGGNPDVTDEEISNAISYMLTESGYDLANIGGADKTADVATAAIASTAAAAATDTIASTKAVVAEVTELVEEKAPAVAETTETAEAAVSKAAETAETEVAQATTTTQMAEQPAAAMQVATLSYKTDELMGKQIYQANCFTCHDVGIANAPVIGDKAAWAQLAEAGKDNLYNNALNGKGAHPPKGGHASLSKEEVIAAVDYMLATAEAAEEAPKAEEAETATQEAPQAEETEVAATEAVATQEAPAPEDTETVTQETEAAETATQEAPKAETAETATQEAPKAEAAEAVTQEAAPEAETAEQTAAAVSHAGINGEKVYRGLCFSCHDMGIAGSPKIGDKAAWTARIAAGNESLYTNSIKGIGIMPAKGGNPALSDDEVKAAVDWMVQQSQ